MYDAYQLAKECHVSIDTVYRVRKQLNLDRLPTIIEIKSRNTHRGRPFNICPDIRTSNVDK